MKQINNDIHGEYIGYRKRELDIEGSNNYTALQHAITFYRRFQEPAMSTLTSISPLTAIARPLFGLSLSAVTLIVFKPLLSGVVRASLLVFKPRAAAVESVSRNRVRDTVYLNRLATKYGTFSPALASELRSLACLDCAND
jgi:hypothetical protein